MYFELLLVYCCYIPYSGLTAFDFLPNIDSTYGIDEDGPIPSNEGDIVVPQLLSHNNFTILMITQTTPFSLLGQSNEFRLTCMNISVS